MKGRIRVKRSLFLPLLTTVALSHVACQTTSDQPPRVAARSYETLEPLILKQAPDVERFLNPGPFSVRVTRNFAIRISQDEVINTDLYLSGHDDQAPLIIFQHGNLGHKGVHENQARLAASWGLHAIVTEQPNEHRWLKNGDSLGKLVKLLHRWPRMLNGRFDPDEIILAGHSFGGSAIAIAAGQGAPVSGLIFLDPALVSDRVKQHLSRIEVPAVLLGADTRVFRSRRRELFYNLYAGDMVEISVRGATHNDAQYPNQFSMAQFVGLDPAPEEEKQERFSAAIVAAAFSLAGRGNTKYAWQAFQADVNRGYFFRAKRKVSEPQPARRAARTPSPDDRYENVMK